MNDEKYVFIQDVREKKNIARSARHVRTHNGAGGAVKFPSDYLSNKERKAMNGECKSYRLNEPLTWEEFGALPNDLKKSYILALRTKFNVPDAEIAKMFDIRPRTLCDYFKRHAELKLSKGKGSGNYVMTWNKDDWNKWLGKDVCDDILVETPVSVEIPERIVSWYEFKKLPDIVKKEYILRLRERFDVPDKQIADMMGTSTTTICKLNRKLDIQTGSASGGTKKGWNNPEWYEWVKSFDDKSEQIDDIFTDIPKTTVEDGAVSHADALTVNPTDIFVDPYAATISYKLLPEYMSLPTKGTMCFDGRIENILPTIAMMLDNKNVHLEVSWEEIEEGC